MQQPTHKTKIRINKAKLWRFICAILAGCLIIANILLYNATAYTRSEQVINTSTDTDDTPIIPTSSTPQIGSPAITINGTDQVLLNSLLTFSTIEEIDDLDINIHIADEDVIALAKMIWGECRGVQGFTAASGRYVSNTEQIAACIWTVLNRVDAGYDTNIVKVITAKNQFTGYKANNPINPAFVSIAQDCLIRWQLEKILAAEGISLDTGRVLPEPDENNKWCWFNADGNGHNAFKGSYGSSTVYDWSLSTPYEEDITIDFNNNLE